ncbi:MAG: D-Ala-D-Ala carboxypeptidase family metallohydrolase [Gemmatimonadales bacterium]
MNGPSVHLTWLELACHDPDRTPYPLEWWFNRGSTLGVVFERFRLVCGNHPITIGSAYRTPRWNRAQGGASRSRHVSGQALDLYPPRFAQLRPGLTTLEAFHAAARVFALAEPIVGGLGLYTWGVHLDTRRRTHGRLVVWNRVETGTMMHDTSTV